jgi:hypothetical protein
MTWNWKGGTASLTNTLSTPAKLLLTAGCSTEPCPILRLQAHDSYRTLGVYLSPSGSQKEQAKFLRSHADVFHSAVSGSFFSPDEAYWAYMLYLRPRLNYPLPCTSLTEKQCHHIQAPALAIYVLG